MALLSLCRPIHFCMASVLNQSEVMLVVSHSNVLISVLSYVNFFAAQERFVSQVIVSTSLPCFATNS